MTDVTHDDFASPLSLVRRWRDLPDGPPLREMVILGYTLDLAFLERVCLPQARQLGARVTVLSDGGQSTHDAVDVRLAGRAYQHGFTATSGAFHPKLAVLIGDHQAWAAIGSGNPTMAGWGHNHELWCVVRGSRDHGPQVQADLGRWLRRLPEAVPMPSWIAETLRDVGSRLVPVTIDDTHTDVSLLHNLDQPIVDQLELGDVEELRLAAPFVDPTGSALHEVIARSSPRRLRIALQPTLSSFNGRALLDAVHAVDDVAFTAVDEARTLHGKLIEWTSPDGATTAVVGSPNLTNAALGGTVGDDHNCELAIRAPVGASLFPDGEPIARADVARTTWNRPDIDVRARSALRLLGCRRDDAGLVVELVCRHAVDVIVETSVDGSPGSWQAKAKIPAATIRTSGITVVPFVAPEVSGGAVRAVATIRGERVESVTVFVTDVVRCRPRTDPGRGPRMREQGPIDDVLAESALSRRFNNDVLRLLDYSAQHRAVPSPQSGGAESVTVGATDRWQRFLDRVEQSFGPNLTALVYPGARTAALATADARWVVGEVHDESELAEGETDEILDDEELFPERPQLPRSEHRRQRSWIRKWVTAVRRPRAGVASRPAMALRLLIAALSVNRLAAGIWGTDDGWRVELADLVEALVPGPADGADEQDQQQGYLESWVAVCLALIVQDASLHGGGEADVVAQRAWNAGHALAARADPLLVERIVADSPRSEEPHARATTDAEVLQIVGLAQEQLDDPLASRLAGFAADGLDVERHAGAWIVRGSFRHAARPAARVLTELCPSGAGVVVATNGKTNAIMVRGGDTVMVAESAVRTWKTFLVRPPMTPMSLFRGGDSAPRADRTQPLRPLPADLVEAATAVHVDVGALVEEFLPRARPRPQWKNDW